MMQQLKPTILTALSILFAVAHPLAGWAGEIGVSSDTILFGQAAALDGPSSALGQGHAARYPCSFRGDQRQRRRPRPQAQTD
jgi:hypothetical protein